MTHFLIHPSDLERRRKRCAPEVARLVKFRREVVTSCNICGSERHVVLTEPRPLWTAVSQCALSGLRIVLSGRSL